jgi:hypothetical protein
MFGKAWVFSSEESISSESDHCGFGAGPEEKFIKILQNGQIEAEQEFPKITQKFHDKISPFFSSCPELLLQVVSSSTPQTTFISIPQATTTDKNTSFPYNMVFKAIIGLTTLYLIYKVAHYASNFWQESKG